mgnify:CR=1 FL=1
MLTGVPSETEVRLVFEGNSDQGDEDDESDDSSAGEAADQVSYVGDDVGLIRKENVYDKENER